MVELTEPWRDAVQLYSPTLDGATELSLRIAVSLLPPDTGCVPM